MAAISWTKTYPTQRIALQVTDLFLSLIPVTNLKIIPINGLSIVH